MDRVFPKVIVYSITYNHASFVKNTLDGFAIQRTDFPYLCCVIDDCSTDNEQDVIKTYIYDHCLPDTIIVSETDYAHIIKAKHKVNDNCDFAIYLLKFNHYSKGLAHKKYEYIDKEWRDNAEYKAFCEGDDFWTDENKLQRQVEALDYHKELDMCVHSHAERNALTGEILCIKSLGNEERIIPVEEMIMGEGGMVGTNTIMARTYLDMQFPPFRQMMNYDYTLQIHGAIKGGVLYIPNTMSVYNVGVPGSFCERTRNDDKFRTEFKQRKMKMLEQLNADLNYKYSRFIYARLLLSSVDVYNSVPTNIKYFIKYRKGYCDLSFKEKFKILLRVFFPMILRNRIRL